MVSHRFSLDYNFDSFVDAYLDHKNAMRNRSKPWVLFAVLLAGLSFAFGSLAIAQDRDDPLSITILAVLALAGAWFGAWPPRKFDRYLLQPRLQHSWKQMKLDGGKTIYEFDRDEFRIDDAFAGGRFLWTELYGWHESEKYLLLYRSDFFFYYLTKSEIEPEVLKVLMQYLEVSPAKRL